MKDFNVKTPTKMAVVGPKNFIQIFNVVGMDIYESLNNINLDDYALILTTDAVPNVAVDKPYPIILEVPKCKGV